jgi:hypothetical protein
MKCFNNVKLKLEFFSVIILLIFYNPFWAAAQEQPVLFNIETDDLIYIKGSSNVTVSESINVNVSDSNLFSATIQIANGYNSSEDKLTVADPGELTVNWNESSGILTLSGQFAVSGYRKALRNVQFINNNASDPSVTTRIVSFTVSDNISNSNAVSRNIIIQSPVDTVPTDSPIDTVPDPGTPPRQ